jgi:hypothetical protein
MLGGTGLALGATTHDINTGSTLTQVISPVTSLLPTPTAQPAPTPAPALPPPVTSVVKTVTTTVQSLTSGPTGAPPPTTKPPAGLPQTHTASSGHQTVVHPQTVQQAAAARHAMRTRMPSGEANANLSNLQAAHAMTFSMPEGPSAEVAPRLAPGVTGPLAEIPDGARHALPVALVVAAMTILAALAAGHLGLWHERRYAQV